MKLECLIFPSEFQLTLISELQAPVKLIDFEYENKENRESDNHTKRLNWSSFKEAPYKSLEMSQQPLKKIHSSLLVWTSPSWSDGNVLWFASQTHFISIQLDSVDPILLRDEPFANYWGVGIIFSTRQTIFSLYFPGKHIF